MEEILRDVVSNIKYKIDETKYRTTKSFSCTLTVQSEKDDNTFTAIFRYDGEDLRVGQYVNRTDGEIKYEYIDDIGLTMNTVHNWAPGVLKSFSFSDA